ncbi:hypothetical protein B566_EDAN015135 [Ephemera danica]|nr:hypothetical protein B566_EDAN015135 [Ephemera danica]
MSMLVNGAAGVTTIFAGVFVNLMGRRALLVSVFISSACITATLPFLNDPTLVQLLYTTGVSIACAAPSTIISAAIDLFPTKLRGMASSLGMLAGRVGIVIGTMAFGFLLELQCQLAFLLISASLAVGAILAFKIPSR